jgi:hypothetical protein
MGMALTRRDFLKTTAAAGCGWIAGCGMESDTMAPLTGKTGDTATVYRSVNGTPAENVRKIFELFGSVERCIGPDDLVVIKPNLQWWNQGAPNIAAVEGLVTLIMERPGGFRGEVVLAENNHRGADPWNSAGWKTGFKRNSDLPDVTNFIELSSLLKNRFKDRFSVCHWIDVSAGGKRVYGPQDGPGYVYCDGTGGVPLISMDNGLTGGDRREVIMSYPVFKTDRGTIIDFKNGVWRGGSYTGQPFRFINLSAVNHHSAYCGMTSAVKNYFGITDISNGADPHKGGKLTDRYFNFHSFAFDEWSKGPVPGMMGAEIGLFMKHIRKADLNIATAEWVGFSSRTDPPVARTRAVLASTDPVALDFHSAKYLLHPNSGCRKHDPQDAKGPLHQYLAQCAEKSGFTLNEANVKVISYDVIKKRLHTGREMAVFGEIDWGKDPKALLKYGIFRFANGFI